MEDRCARCGGPPPAPPGSFPNTTAPRLPHSHQRSPPREESSQDQQYENPDEESDEDGWEEEEEVTLGQQNQGGRGVRRDEDRVREGRARGGRGRGGNNNREVIYVDAAVAARNLV